MDFDFFCSCRPDGACCFSQLKNLARGPVSVSPTKMWDPGLWALQSRAERGCSVHVMFSPGSCVRVRHLAGQLAKQSGPLICSDVMCAQPKTFSSFVFMLAGAVSSMVCFSTLLPFAQSINMVTACSFIFLKMCKVSTWWEQLYVTWLILAWLLDRNYKNIKARWPSVWLNRLIDWLKKSACLQHSARPWKDLAKMELFLCWREAREWWTMS